MAEEVEMTPVDAAAVPAEPPKVNPLAKPAAPALKPGLKLPPKPGATIMAKPGLKLPPKPGATLGVKPGLKLPPKPGATLMAKPMIRKPGTGGAVVGKPLPKPVQATPAAPAPAAAAPAPAPAVAPAGESSLEALKSVTQKLKGVTQQIPQQAVLHKTGIIAESASPNAPTDAQKEASKHKTARISLSEAIGVAPVKSEPAPMKTIRIKRPINLPSQPPTAAAPAAEAAPAAPETTEPSAEGTSLTQRKTLKITRPGATVRPAGKFGVKKPGVTAAAPKADAPAGEVADIPEIPDMPADSIPSAIPPMPMAAEPANAGPLTMVSILIGLAACVAVGALAFYLYGDAQLPTYCGGLGWGS